jgi:hypothetical protein
VIIQEVSVVVAYGMVQREGIHCLCGQQCVVEFFHESAELQEMVDRGAQGEEEVMRVEERGATVQDSE